jgi:OOP family OmpA-OmpF porin
MKKILPALFASSILFTSQAYSKTNYDSRYYLSPAISYLQLDNDRDSSKNGKGISIGLGKAVSQNVNLEIKTFYQKYNSNQSTQLNKGWRNFGLSGDFQYYFSRNSFSPYFVAGLGVMNSKTNSDKALGLIAEAGFGVKKDISENFALRADLRYRYNNNFNKELAATNNSRQYNDMVATIGIVIPIGNLQTSNNSNNSNSNKITKEKLDSDFDGVEDSFDRCPNSAAKVKVDSRGCEIGLKLEGVNFYAGSPKLTNEAKIILDETAENLLRNQKHLKTIEVQGHSSGDGSEKFNLYLSKERANSVAQYLKDKGVKNQFIVNGYGSSQKIASDETIEGRIQNRRVELHWR